MKRLLQWLGDLLASSRLTLVSREPPEGIRWQDVSRNSSGFRHPLYVVCVKCGAEWRDIPIATKTNTWPQSVPANGGRRTDCRHHEINNHAGVLEVDLDGTFLFVSFWKCSKCGKRMPTTHPIETGLGGRLKCKGCGNAISYKEEHFYRFMRPIHFKAAASESDNASNPRESQSFDDLIDDLKGDVALHQIRAAELLGDLGDCRAILPLFRTMNLGGSRQLDKTRDACREALNKLAKADLRPLIKALGTKNYYDAKEALVAVNYSPVGVNATVAFYLATYKTDKVAALGAPALKWILRMMEHNETSRENMVRAIGDLQDPAAIPELLSALSHQNHNVRAFAAVALGKLKCKEAVPGIAKLLGDWNTVFGDGYVTSRAVRALGQIGDPAAIKPLQRFCETELIEKGSMWLWRSDTKDGKRVKLEKTTATLLLAIGALSKDALCQMLKEDQSHKLVKALYDRDRSVTYSDTTDAERWKWVVEDLGLPVSPLLQDKRL